MKILLGLVLSVAFAVVGPAAARTIDAAPLGHGLRLEYYVSAPPGAADANILIVVHGYPRDANRTFDAAANAAAEAGHSADTLIVAPIFQVPANEADKCHFHGVPPAKPGDALWHCDDWADGNPAINGPVTSFQAMDLLVASLLHRDPAAHTVTIAGFSAGGQYVQHYIGFANAPARAVILRYVVGDPSEFVYFVPSRPVPGVAACPGYNDWKFGTDHLPTYLGRDAATVRAVYANAKVRYLEGALDTGMGRGAAYRLLEKNCGAELQGTYRLQRGEAYAAYDQAALAHGAHPLIIVPGCAHSVTCVFPSAAARDTLFGSE
jgi:hypothetical protein